MAARRMTREERKSQTRDALVAAAREVFARRGFHGASLEEITLEAGCTTGAVYSSFRGKDDLFLAVLDEHIDRRMAIYVDEALDAEDIEAAGRRWLKAEVELGRQEPQWNPLLVEFWAHAARREDLREAVLVRHRRQLDAMTALMDAVAERHGGRLRLPTRDVVRAIGALGRGLGLERLVEDGHDLGDLYEEFVMAATLALFEPRSAP